MLSWLAKDHTKRAWMFQDKPKYWQPGKLEIRTALQFVQITLSDKEILLFHNYLSPSMYLQNDEFNYYSSFYSANLEFG